MAISIRSPEQSRFALFKAGEKKIKPEKLSANDAHRVGLILAEINQLPTTERKKQLLHHQFSAQVKEEIGLPFHSYAMALKKSGDNSFEAHDYLYGNSNVTERCQRAIDIAKTEVERIRYTLEKKQVTNLLELVSFELEALEHSLLAEMSENQPSTFIVREQIITQLKLLNWQYAPLISSEVAKQFNLKPKTTCIVGPKFFYIMPKSSVHKGWKTMYLIAQPVYLPETDQWLILQDQHMCSDSWEKYQDILGNIGDSSYKHTYANQSSAQNESTIMNTCIQLDSKYQKLSAREVFCDLVYRQLQRNFELEQIQQAQEHLQQISAHLENSFELHSDYLLSIMDYENQWEFGWSREKEERLLQAYINSYGSLYHQQPISETQTEVWIEEYTNLYSSSKNRSSSRKFRNHFRALSAINAPWLALAIESNLECSLLALPSLTLKSLTNPHFLSLIATNNLTFNQLELLIGKERAQRWKKGVCIACGEKNVWIGDKHSRKECDVCIRCEIADNQKKSQMKKDVQHIHPSGNIQKQFPRHQIAEKPLLSNNTIGLTEFLAAI